jgi:cytochrome P450
VPFEPYSQAFAADPYPVYAHLRETTPVFHDPAFGMTFLTRHRDILAVLTDKRFGRARPGEARPDEARPDEATTDLSQRNLPYYDRYVRRNLLETEGEPHRRLRRQLAAGLNPKRVSELALAVRDIADELVNKLETGTGFDFIAELAEPLPVIVIATLLGWPDDHRHRLRPWSADIVRLYEKDASDDDAARAELASREFATMLQTLADDRKFHPQGDLISELVTFETETGDLSRDELIASCMLLLNAGHEATVNAAGNGMLALLRHPEAIARLREQPDLIDSAVEEMLRYDPPLHLFHRFATEDATIAGHDFRAGDTLGLLYGSANRDPDVFDNPNVFDIQRTPNRHLAFGAATHFCLGATLARLELRTLFGALLAKATRLELLETQPEYRTGLVFRGLKRLMVRI